MAPAERRAGERLIIVGGAPRSGTTLLQNILDSHPDVYGGPEFDHLPSFIALRRALRASITSGRIDAFCAPADVDRHIAQLIEGFLVEKADRVGARYLSEKTPANAVVLDELLDVLPGARAIHVVRDPRAVVASLLAVRQRHLDGGDALPPHLTDERAVLRHVQEHLNGAYLAAEKHPHRVGTIVYRDLVQDPEGMTKGLCAWLGLEWVPAMADPSSVRHDGEHLAAQPNHWYTVERFRSSVDDSRIEAWKQELAPHVIELVEHRLQHHPALAGLGYDFVEA